MGHDNAGGVLILGAGFDAPRQLQPFTGAHVFRIQGKKIGGGDISNVFEPRDGHKQFVHRQLRCIVCEVGGRRRTTRDGAAGPNNDNFRFCRHGMTCFATARLGRSYNIRKQRHSKRHRKSNLLEVEFMLRSIDTKIELSFIAR